MIFLLSRGGRSSHMADTSIYPSNSSVSITQPFPALPGRCWGPTNPSAKANCPPADTSILFVVSLAPPPAALPGPCGSTAPVAPAQPWLSQQQHGEALEQPQAESGVEPSVLEPTAPTALGCPPPPHPRQTHTFTPQSSSSGDAECSAQRSTALGNLHHNGTAG